MSEGIVDFLSTFAGLAMRGAAYSTGATLTAIYVLRWMEVSI